jgi:aspartyl protease family protein
MNPDDLPRVIYLGLIIAVLIGSYLASNRGNMGKVAQQAAIWGLIFVGVIAAYGLWNDMRPDLMLRQQVLSEGIVEVPRSPDGHYYVTAQVNGVPVDFVIDTGASEMVLSQADAARIGLDPANLAYLGTALTANGEVRTAPVRLDTVNLSGIEDTNIRAVVNEGAMDGSLLGMGYLGLYARIEIADGKLILTR